MTLADVANSERETLARVADDLSRRGYEVVINPRFDELPEFLQDFQPDAVARGDEEVVVIEVKAAGAAYEGPRLRKLAEEISRHPGWRLQIVLASPPGEGHEGREGLPTIPEIRETLLAARRLFESGDAAPAVLLIWSLLEAALHRRLERMEVDRPRAQSPHALVKDLVSFGFVDQAEYRNLGDLADLRNALAHGRLGSEIEPAAFARLQSLVEELIDQAAVRPSH